MMHCKFLLKVLIELLLYTRICGQLALNMPEVGNYGEETHMNCTEASFDITNGYTWYKDNLIIYDNINGDATGKYTSTHGIGFFTLTITNTVVNDAGEYACNYNFVPQSGTLEIQAKGTVTAELSSHTCCKLEVTFHKIYPSTPSVVIIRDLIEEKGNFVSNETNGDRFTIRWESDKNYTSVPSYCSVDVTLVTTFNVAFVVNSDPISGDTGDLSTRDSVIIVTVQVGFVSIIVVVILAIKRRLPDDVGKRQRELGTRDDVGKRQRELGTRGKIIVSIVFGVHVVVVACLPVIVYYITKNNQTINKLEVLDRVTPLSKNEGEKVILPCMSGNFTFPEWRGPPNLTLYTIKNDTSGNISTKAPAFIRLQYDSNNRSLILSNAATSDSGDYKCSYTGLGDHTIRLTVQSATTQASTTATTQASTTEQNICPRCGNVPAVDSNAKNVLAWLAFGFCSTWLGLFIIGMVSGRILKVRAKCCCDCFNKGDGCEDCVSNYYCRCECFAATPCGACCNIRGLPFWYQILWASIIGIPVALGILWVWTCYNNGNKDTSNNVVGTRSHGQAEGVNKEKHVSVKQNQHDDQAHKVHHLENEGKQLGRPQPLPPLGANHSGEGSGSVVSGRDVKLQETNTSF